MICIQEDDYTRSKFLDTARWEARLSDGSFVISDNDRPELEERSAWIRLGKYLDNKLFPTKIISLQLRFRDHVVKSVPDNAYGYFIRDAVYTTLDSSVSTGLILIGYLPDKLSNEIIVQSWRIPELILMNVESRDINDQSKVGPSLILNER